MNLFLSLSPSSLPPFPLSAILPRTQCSLSLETATTYGGWGGRCAVAGEGAGDFENPMKRHGARGRVLRFRQTVVLGQKVVQMLRPGARATNKAAAASTQLTRLRAKLRPGAGTGGVSWPLCSVSSAGQTRGGLCRPAPACLSILALPKRGQGA